MSFLDSSSLDDLRQLLTEAYDRFDAYRAHFVSCGVSRAELVGGDVQAAFARLKVIDKTTYAALQNESRLGFGASPFVVDPSSGSTGSPVLKFTSRADDEAEALAVKEAFLRAGVTPGDRCLCIDVGASQIYLFYMRVLRELGAGDLSFIKATRDNDQVAGMLLAYKPDVIVSIPSVLHRAIPSLRRLGGTLQQPVRSIVTIGEPLDDALRFELRSILGAQCFSFYGTTEVGSIGIECEHHDGMHIPTRLFVPTLRPWLGDQECRLGESRYRGIVAWTALRIKGQPVVKYSVNDLVEIDLGVCACGSSLPRLIFRHRTDEAFFLFGITFTYQYFRDLLEKVVDRSVEVEIRLITQSDPLGTKHKIMLVLDESLASCSAHILEAITTTHPISDLLWGRLVDVELEFSADSDVLRRKTRRVFRLDETLKDVAS